MKIGDKIRPTSGAWPCGCDDEDGEITKLEEIDDEPMAFVGTPCGWQWFPVAELRPVSVARPSRIDEALAAIAAEYRGAQDEDE